MDEGTEQMGDGGGTGMGAMLGIVISLIEWIVYLQFFGSA